MATPERHFRLRPSTALLASWLALAMAAATAQAPQERAEAPKAVVPSSSAPQAVAPQAPAPQASDPSYLPPSTLAVPPDRSPRFLGFPTSYEEVVHLEELNLSARYDDQPAIEAKWLPAYDSATAVELPDVKNRYAVFVSARLRRIDVAIRGTVNLKNAAFDAEFLKDRSASLGVRLHSGFERVATAVYRDLRPRLREGYRIRVTGHSLGAAEAIIVGMLLSRDGYKVDLVLASAPPKVTDREGWSWFPSLRVVRVVCPYDPVPFLPPRSLLYGKDPYVQGDSLLMLLDGDKATVMPPSFYDDLPDAVGRAAADGRHFDTVDHFLKSYMSRLLPKKAGAVQVDPLSWDAWAVPAGK